MSNTLSNPNRPAGAIVKQRDDGSALRNDGVELQAANTNPWYVLATIFGEQPDYIETPEGGDILLEGNWQAAIGVHGTGGIVAG